MSSNREYNYDSFADTLLEFAKHLVIKNETRAKEHETIESLRNANSYILAYECADTYNMYSDWTEIELEKAGADKDLIFNILSNKDDIPEWLKPELLRVRRETLVNSYTEYNNYYRMLNGLPNYGEDGIMTSFNKPTTELNEDELFHLQQGELDILIKQNPDKEYLKYLGEDNSIDFYTARKAKNYEILNYKKYILEEAQAAKFQELYYQSRQYVTIANYSKAFKNMYYYDAFIIILILFLAMQKYINETYNFAIRKDFYDMEDIKNTFLSFGLPFFSEIPIKYQRNIVKNINNLLKYKGTDKCLVDIVKLFGFQNVDLYKYFLIKDFKRTVDGDPDINLASRELTYELKWAQVPFDTTDITAALQNTTLYQDYELIVGDDPFWGDYYDDNIDENIEKFKKELLNVEFNYINTKYLAVNTMFSVSRNTLDSAYFFNMINTLQNNGNLDKLTFINKDIKPSGNSIRLFDSIAALYYLLCKKLGYEDNIIKSTTATASIYDFKFNKDTDQLLNQIENKTYLTIDSTAIKYRTINLKNGDVKKLKLDGRYYNSEDLVDMYFNNIDYRDFLIERMNSTTDYMEYSVLSDIYNYNMVSETMTNAYDGYETYSDYLLNRDSELYSYVSDNSQNTNALNLTINNILYAIESNLNSFKFDNMFSSLSSMSGDIVKSYIMKMINVFKAYTVELKRINIYYIFDEKWLNRIKLLTFMYMNVDTVLSESTLTQLLDIFEKIDVSIKNIERLGITSDMMMEMFKYIKDRIRIELEDEYDINMVVSDGIDIDTNQINANYIENTLLIEKKIYLNDRIVSSDYGDKNRLFIR